MPFHTSKRVNVVFHPNCPFTGLDGRPAVVHDGGPNPVVPPTYAVMFFPYAVYEPLLVNLITVYAPLVVIVGEPVVVPV